MPAAHRTAGGRDRRPGRRLSLCFRLGRYDRFLLQGIRFPAAEAAGTGEQQ